ncbi:OmpA family protein [Maritalea sp.]|uniref:OmpA family protein n=1 Tax=Maritalea sp. TaxID=2003361 RepID=UPI003EF5B247
MGSIKRVKWFTLLIAGVLTIGVGSAVAVWQTQAYVEAELNAGVSEKLHKFGHKWTSVDVVGRDVTISGLSTNTAEIDEITKLVAAHNGVRSVSLDIQVAPKMEPFKLSLSQDGKSRSMVGGMPNDHVTKQVTDWFGEGDVSLALASGSPRPSDWRDASQFAIRLLQHFDQGNVEVEGLTVSMAGRAKDHDAYHTLDVVFGAGFPDNLVRGSGEIIPPLVAPYELSGQKSSQGNLSLEGNVHSQPAKAELREAGLDVANLQISSGAPKDFENSLGLLVKSLDELLNGEFSISDDRIQIQGEVPNFEVYDDVSGLGDQLGAFNVTVNLERPVIQPFTLKLELRDQQMVVSGYVPSEEGLAKLQMASMPVDVSKVRVARGAPEQFETATEMLVDALGHLYDGASAEIEDQKIVVQGKAITPQDFLALQEKFGTQIPDGYDLAIASIELPTVSPYSWSLTKETTDRVRMAGYSPSKQFNSQVLQQLNGVKLMDETLPAIGQPAEFETVAIASAAASNHMVEGQVILNDGQWSLASTIANKEMKNNIFTEFSNKGIKVESWQAQFTELAPPVAKPYRFSAVWTNEAEFSFDGYVPNEDLQLLLLGMGTSNVSLASGEPDRFEEIANIGISALQQLEEGEFGFDGERWHISGTATDTQTVEKIKNDLGDFTADGSGWTIELTARIVPVVPYIWSAQKSKDADIVVSGYAPEQAVIDEWMALPNVSGQPKIGVGAPDEFQSRANVALSSLQELETGRASLSGNTWSLIGRAKSDQALENMMKILTPFSSSFRLDVHVVQPIDQLIFSAEQTENGLISYTGYLDDPLSWKKTPDNRALFIGKVIEEREPFVARIENGLAAVQMLNFGRLSYDGTAWKIEGEVADKAIAAAVKLTLGDDEDPVWMVNLSNAEVKAKAKAEADEKERMEAEAKAKADAEESARIEAETKAIAAEEARLEAEARAKAEAEAEAEEKLRLEAETQAIAAEKARLEAEAKAKAKAEAEVQAEAAAQAETEAKEKAETEEKLRLEAEANAEEKSRLESEAKAKAQAEENARLGAEAKAKAEADEKAKQSEIGLNFTWSAKKAGSGFEMLGNVPDPSARYSLQLAVGAAETPSLDVAAGAPDRFLSNALTGILALEHLDEGEVTYSKGAWELSGATSDFVSRDKSLASLTTSPGDWVVNIKTPPAHLICGEIIADLVKQKAISFQSGSAKLDNASTNTLGEIAKNLQICPKTFVEVEGHTDSDGPADANLTLSVMRAERVVDELVELGVDAGRIFAIGYGESLPIASNDNRAGKKENRRIVFAVREAVE